mmetsp:Transcript_106849/g.194386  ORF Transcript_106849/g.194386 Transcript_106849/m.194386 type:complete len:206 (-) Transcript_106849:216-833(-)
MPVWSLHKSKNCAAVCIRVILLALVVGKHLQHFDTVVFMRRLVQQQLWMLLCIFGMDEVNVPMRHREAQHREARPSCSVLRRALQMCCAEVVGVKLGELLFASRRCRLSISFTVHVLVGMRGEDEGCAFFGRACYDKTIGVRANMLARNSPAKPDQQLFNYILLAALPVSWILHASHRVTVRLAQFQPCVTTCFHVIRHPLCKSV